MIPLSTDWMGVSLRLLDDVGAAPKNHVWVKYDGGTNVWACRRVLFNRYGERVLTLLSQPKASLIDPAAALCEISNEWLYHGIGVKGALRLLQRSVPYEITGLSRLDLCCDFVPNEAQREVIEGLADGSMYISGKRSGSGFWSVNADEWMPNVWRGRKIPHCQSWGHKTSDVKWKLYYKSKELKDAAAGQGFDKPYIVDIWRECKMDVNNVWRLEVSVSHCNKLCYNGLPVTFDTWYEHTIALFKALFSARFVVKRSQGHADKSNDERVWFLPIQSDDIIRCKVYEGEACRSARLTLLRHLVKAADSEEIRLDKFNRELTIEHVQKIVKYDRLERYFENMTGMSVDEWENQLTENVDVNGYYKLISDRPVMNDLKPNTKFDN